MTFPKKPLPPTIYHSLETDMDCNRKYAPKFVNHLFFVDKEHLTLRTKYMKKVSNIACQLPRKQEKEMKPLIYKIAKRFNKYCKGDTDLGPKILSSFPSLKECQLNKLFHLPFHFKSGRFSKLLLDWQIPYYDCDSSKVVRQVSKIVTNVKRFKHIKDLKIDFDRDTLHVFAPLMSQFKKYPQRLTSLQNFALSYESSGQDGLIRFLNSIDGLKNVVPSITHLSISSHTNTDKPVNLNFHDFRRLKFLSVYFRNWNIWSSVSLEALTNLETFQLGFRTPTNGYFEDFLMCFRPPKSVKKIILGLYFLRWSKFLPLTEPPEKNEIAKKSFKNFSFAKFLSCISLKKLKPQIQYQIIESPFEKFFEEEWNPAKEF